MKKKTRRNEGIVVDICQSCTKDFQPICGLCEQPMEADRYKGERWWYCLTCSETGYGLVD
jgi:hypothetical protein